MNYYSIQVTTQGSASSTAFYYVNVLSPGALAGAAVTLYPTAAQATWFGYQENALQFQAPAGRAGAGATVITDSPRVIGTLGVSPAINVDTVLNLYGAANPIGSVTLPAGQTSIPFDFQVSSEDAIQKGDVEAALQKVAPKPEA
ncbi:MAG TPA: hypothetical protein VE974_15160 [Thermoanaerobaculia bacterium]|nr:hypothetical protein [Thermoanaerobaculia bacterium]